MVQPDLYSGQYQDQSPVREGYHNSRANQGPTLSRIDRMITKILLFNLSGHGHFDMSAYVRYFKGELEDFDYPEAAIKESLAHLPKVELD
jgi:hypothetical protein